jgi:hypothetical protein
VSKLDDYFVERRVRTERFAQVWDRVLRELNQDSGGWNAAAYQLELICDYISERYQKAYEADWWPVLCPVVERDVLTVAGRKLVPWLEWPDSAESVEGYEPMDAIRAVWSVDPRAEAAEPEMLGYKLTPEGIVLPQSAGAKVWIEFRLRPPRLTRKAYAGATAYNREDVVLHGGECWRCLQDAQTGVTPGSNAAVWERQWFPALFTRYVAKGVFADWSRKHGDSQELADRESNRAQAELDRISDVARPVQRQQAFVMAASV